MNRSDLEALSPEAVKQVAADLGVKFHHKHGVSKIIDAILQAQGGEASEGDDLPEVQGAPKAVHTAKQSYNPDVVPKVAAKNFVPQPAAEENALIALINKEMAEWPTVEEAQAALEPSVRRGLQVVELNENFWHIRVKNREASGNLKMPLKLLLQQANLLFNATAMPTEDLDMEEILALKVPRR